MLAMNYCPSCTNEMQLITIEGVELVQCAPCAGVLVGWSGLERLFVGERQTQVLTSEALLAHLTRLGSPSWAGPLRNHHTCFACTNAPFSRKLGSSVTPFRYCETHGAIFDIPTLNRLLHGVLTGVAPGVAAARNTNASGSADTTLKGGADVGAAIDVGDMVGAVVDALSYLFD